MNIEQDKQSRQFFKYAIGALLFLLVSRIISMIFIPINDVSEARYAEIARKMLETGNWITPLHDYGVPFWAKPPLSTWLSALSMKLLGINEFSVRLPGLLLSLGVLWLVWHLVKKYSDSFLALCITLVLAGTLYFFLDAGTVMTDPSLVFCITLVIVSFWHAVVGGEKRWSYVFFIGLGLGLLAKGPIALVLSGMPLFCWVLLRNQWRTLWEKLPWFQGIFITLVIALPWYVLAEHRTPGFLDYFIVGEHWNRFLKPGWKGDKYGYAHQVHLGMIWVYAAAAIFPWCFLGIAWFIKCRHNVRDVFRDNNGWLSYFFLCTIIPLCFFTFSRNIIHTYVFPSLPPFAIFFTEYWHRVGVVKNARFLMIKLSLLTPLIFLAATLAFHVAPQTISKTQKQVIETWLNQHPADGSYLIYWNSKAEFSAQFYSKGKAKFASNNEALCRLLSNNQEHFLLVPVSKKNEIRSDLFSQMVLSQRINAGKKPFLLMRIPVLDC